MQKLVKKNFDIKISNHFTKKFSKKFNKQSFSKFGKKKKAYGSFSRKAFKLLLKHKRVGRCLKRFKPLQKKKYIRFTVKVVQNNVFCSLKDSEHNRILKNICAGTYKMNVTKKGLRFQSKTIVEYFLKDIRDMKLLINKPIITRIIAPIGIRRSILQDISRLFFKKLKKRKAIIIEVDPKKVFNGCKARKSLRKKRKKFILSK